MDDDSEPVNFSQVIRGYWRRHGSAQGKLTPALGAQNPAPPEPPAPSEINDALRARRPAVGVQHFSDHVVKGDHPA